jgi:hypothetical protein
MPRRYCEWTEIQEDSRIYNTCQDEFHLTEGLDLYPYCPFCGGTIKVVEVSGEDDVFESGSPAPSGGADGG